MTIVSDHKPNKKHKVVDIEKEVDNQFEFWAVVFLRGIDLQVHDPSLYHPA